MVPELVEQFRNRSNSESTVTPLGVDARWFERESPERIAELRRRHGLRDRYLLFVGTLQPRKNVARILAAFEQLRSIAAVGGPAGHRRQGRLARPMTSSRRCERPRQADTFAGSIMSMRMTCDALYQGAAGFVFPSLYEGFGMPVLEAFASGVPVITSCTTSLPEVAGDAALLVDPTDIDAIAAAMVSVIEDSLLAGRLRAAGHWRAPGRLPGRAARPKRSRFFVPSFRNRGFPRRGGFRVRGRCGRTVDDRLFRCIIALLCCTFFQTHGPQDTAAPIRSFGEMDCSRSLKIGNR